MDTPTFGISPLWQRASIRETSDGPGGHPELYGSHLTWMFAELFRL